MVTITRTDNPNGVAASGNVATYDNAAIGTATGDRIVVVLIGTELTASSINSVTLGGTTMNAGTQGNSGAVYARAFYLAYPSGTTATIAVTFGANASGTQNHIAVYSIYGGVYSSTGATQGTDIRDTALSTGSTTIAAGGGMIAVVSAEDVVANTWSQLGEDLDVSGGAFQFSTAYSTTAGTQTRTCAGGNNNEVGAMSWLIFTAERRVFVTHT